MTTSRIRRAAEILLGPITVRRRLPKSVGSGIVCASAAAGGLRYILRRSSRLDPILLSVARAIVRLGDVTWDIGGNVGLFAAAAAGLSGHEGRVYAIEPDPYVYRFLTRTALSRRDGHAKISPICGAIAVTPSIVTLQIATRCRSANYLEGYGTTQTGGVSDVRLVPALSLDCMIAALPRPDVIKIDVEGAETAVLEGATALLTSIRPRLYIEVAGENAYSVGETLRSHDYRLFDGATLSSVHSAAGAPCETVAIPFEQQIPGMLRNE